jgi:hypothetical protein
MMRDNEKGNARAKYRKALLKSPDFNFRIKLIIYYINMARTKKSRRGKAPRASGTTNSILSFISKQKV